MKKLLLLFLLACCNTVIAQNSFDQKLADSLGADDFGMKQYMLVILKTGSAAITEKAVVDSLFRGHMNNIGRLAREHKLIVAGPLKKNDRTYRGIFILNTANTEEAKAMILSDPAVKAGLLDYEMFEWYGSAALPMYIDFHNKVLKKHP